MLKKRKKVRKHIQLTIYVGCESTSVKYCLYTLPTFLTSPI